MDVKTCGEIEAGVDGRGGDLGEAMGKGVRAGAFRHDPHQVRWDREPVRYPGGLGYVRRAGADKLEDGLSCRHQGTYRARPATVLAPASGDFPRVGDHFSRARTSFPG